MASSFVLHYFKTSVFLVGLQLWAFTAWACHSGHGNAAAVLEAPAHKVKDMAEATSSLVSAEEGVKAYEKMRQRKEGTVEQYIASALPCREAVPEGYPWPHELLIAVTYKGGSVDKFESITSEKKFVGRFITIVASKCTEQKQCSVKQREVDDSGMVEAPIEANWSLLSPGPALPTEKTRIIQKGKWVRFNDGGLECMGDVLAENGPLGESDASGGRALIRVFFLRGEQVDLDENVRYVIRPKKSLAVVDALPKMTLPASCLQDE
jgi:hypothetical protein